MFENGTKTLVDISTFWAGVDSFLWLIAEAIFHMLPVGICWSVTKKMGTTQILGIILGLTLVSGQLLNAYAVGTTAVADIPVWDFGAFTLNKIGYQAQVIPAILAAFTLVYLEKFFRKITPQAISMIVVPFCSLLLAVIAAHAVLGPIGWKIGDVISDVVYAGITGTFKIVFAAIFGFFYAPLVITGLHHMSNAIDLQLIGTFDGTMLWPMIALSNIAQGSAVLAMIILQKKNAKAQEVNIPSMISCYLGVTEPAMFGVNLKYSFPFLSAMIGSACAAVISVATSTTAHSIGVGGIPGILSIKVENMLTFAIAMAVAIGVPFLLTFTIGKKKLSSKTGELIVKEEAPKVEVTNETTMSAFLDGQVITLKEVNDGVFSEGTLGEGLAIIPENDLVYAPISGKISALIEDSRHACGIVADNGMEILIHVGLDTVNMKGDGFEYLVKQDQYVTRGTPLIRFDKEKIKKAGHADTTILVITEQGTAKNIQFITGSKAVARETTIVTFE